MPTVVRGCGERVAGGAYISVPMGEGGSAVENFLIDPPMAVDIEAMGLSAIGTAIRPWNFTDTKTLEQVHTHYVFDVVGRQHYPNVADFVEEARRFGVSRRISRTTDFSKLDAKSRLVLVHERGWIDNSAEYHNAREIDRIWCPRDIPRHLEPQFDGMCASLWWEDIEGGDNDAEPNDMLVYGKSIKYDQAGVQMHLQRYNQRAVMREMPSFRYRGLATPEGVVPKYRHAAFATFPIRLIEVVRDREGGTHEETLRRAKRGPIEVVEVDE